TTFPGNSRGRRRLPFGFSGRDGGRAECRGGSQKPQPKPGVPSTSRWSAGGARPVSQVVHVSAASRLLWERGQGLALLRPGWQRGGRKLSAKLVHMKDGEGPAGGSLGEGDRLQAAGPVGSASGHSQDVLHAVSLRCQPPTMRPMASSSRVAWP